MTTIKELRAALMPKLVEALEAEPFPVKAVIFKDTVVLVHPDHYPQIITIEQLGYNGPETEALAAQVFMEPAKGDQLTYNGRRWVASRVKGQDFAVKLEDE